MKKILLGLFLLVLVATLAACGAEQGEYTPGVYHGYTVGEKPFIAVVTVDDNGMIISVLLDEVYVNSANEAVTKRALDNGCGYNMHAGDVVNCSVEGELMWWEQVDALAAAVVEAQGLPNWTLDGGRFSEDTDGVAGVTIRIGGHIDAIESALNKAK